MQQDIRITLFNLYTGILPQFSGEARTKLENLLLNDYILNQDFLNVLIESLNLQPQPDIVQDYPTMNIVR